MRRLVWNMNNKPVLPGQITTISGYPVWITSVDGELRARYSEKGQSVVVQAGTIGAHWEDKPSLFKVAPGDWPEDFGHENGQYQNQCHRCLKTFMGHKRRIVCKVCAFQFGIQALTEGKDAPTDGQPVGQMSAPRTMDSAELFQHFRNFRYAEMGVTGLGSAYPDALAFIDEQVAIRVAEILKGKP